MKERPIIFSAPMVRAILSGAKTQTRRIIKPQPIDSADDPIGAIDVGVFHPTVIARGEEAPGPEQFGAYTVDGGRSWRCPYGQPGQCRLWVRETWGALPHMMGGVQRETLRYRADGEYQNERGTWRWRPPIHMPRWASRITLEITDVRVERLQDISEADAKAEGVSMPDGTPTPPDFWSYQQEFRHLWEQINGPGSWDANPFVWVVTFRRIDHA